MSEWRMPLVGANRTTKGTETPYFWQSWTPAETQSNIYSNVHQLFVCNTICERDAGSFHSEKKLVLVK